MSNNCEKTETSESIFLRTLSNCIYYEKNGKMQHLLNEIGVLRGIAYIVELNGVCPHTPEFLRYIEIQNQLLKKEQ